MSKTTIYINASSFKDELQKCLLLSDKDKSYWIKQSGTLPPIILRLLFQKVWEVNRRVDLYLKTALKNDSDFKLGKQLKSLVKKLQTDVFLIEESNRKELEEADLENLIKNI